MLVCSSRILKSMKQFNDQEIKGVILGQLKTTDEENAFLLAFWRAVHNVDSMLELTNVLHFQALANLARTMLEIAADIRLLDIIPNAVQKLLFFNRLEKLKAAKGILTYQSKHTLSMPVDTSPYAGYVATQEASIVSELAILWPSLKLKDLRHWTGLNLSERVNKVGQPVQELYNLFHRMLSWYVHSGGVGVMGLPAETFPSICSLSYRTAALTFEEVIKVTAKKFKLTWIDDSLEKKLEYAKALPLTSSPGARASVGQRTRFDVSTVQCRMVCPDEPLEFTMRDEHAATDAPRGQAFVSDQTVETGDGDGELLGRTLAVVEKTCCFGRVCDCTERFDYAGDRREGCFEVHWSPRLLQVG